MPLCGASGGVRYWVTTSALSVCWKTLSNSPPSSVRMAPIKLSSAAIVPASRFRKLVTSKRIPAIDDDYDARVASEADRRHKSGQVDIIESSSCRTPGRASIPPSAQCRRLGRSSGYMLTGVNE